MFGWDFKVDFWSRFWQLSLIKIFVWTCFNFGKLNSTLRSVVPLTKFFILIVYRAGYRYKSQSWKYPHDDWQIHMLTSPSYVFVYIYWKVVRHTCTLVICRLMLLWRVEKENSDRKWKFYSVWYQNDLDLDYSSRSAYRTSTEPCRASSLFKIMNLRLFNWWVPALVRTPQSGQIELPNHVLLLQDQVCWGN